jgi:hypothetical protein
MWARQAKSREIEASDPELAWAAEHDGYGALSPAAVHRRSVRFDQEERAIEITDVIDDGGHDVRMAFHLGPEVSADLVAGSAMLSWEGPDGSGAARLELPGEFDWQSHRGETSPILGWYSVGLGERVPAVTLLGQGRCTPGIQLITRLFFIGNENLLQSTDLAGTVSLETISGGCGKELETEAESK